MLRESPACLQRLIARRQRISLPRNCSFDERVSRLRRALCRAATVRATYASLDPIVQAALHALRQMRGGIAPAELTRRFGVVRSLTQLAADPRPRSTAEQLILMGWLLPRPARPRHPPRYILPPELRRWLPRPLQLATHGSISVTGSPPLLRAAATLLLTCAERPLAVRANGMPRRASLRLLHGRLAPTAPDEASSLVSFTCTLLYELGLVVQQHGRCVLAPAGQRFLDLPAGEQLNRLQTAWIRLPTPDSWLAALLPLSAAIDWPLLRRRLLAWAASLPAGQLLEIATLYPALAASFGPLGDAQTHGYRPVHRVPWQPRRAAAVFEAALRGPLHWFGSLMCTSQEAAGPAMFCARPSEAAPAPPCRWRYGEPGRLIVPHGAINKALLHVLPFGDWVESNADETIYRFSPAGLARACSSGWSVAELWAALEAQAGPAPAEWRVGLEAAPPVVRIEHVAVLSTGTPAALERAKQSRTVRRYLRACPAPGIALVDSEHVAPLARALASRHIAIRIASPGPAVAPAELKPGDAAALLAACAFYRRFAPAGAPLLPHAGLEQSLRARLTPALRAAADAAAATSSATGACDPIATPTPDLVSMQPASAALGQGRMLALLRAAIADNRAVELVYIAPHGGETTRLVRPSALEERDAHIYMRAYCTLRRAERTFRLDRIAGVRIAGRRPHEPATSGRRRSSSSDEMIRRIGAHLPDPQHLDLFDSQGVEEIEPYAVAM